MVILTDTASLSKIPEGTKASKIMILCEDGESFAAQDVSKMLALSAQMTPIPKSASSAFAFGKIAGSMSGKPEDIVVLTSDAEVSAAAEAFGYSTSIGKTKSRSVKPKAPRKKVTEIMTPPETPSGEKVPAKFAAILKNAGVTDADPEKILDAVKSSQEYVSYELQLRLKLMDGEKAADVYGKTKDKFAELKKASGPTARG